MGLKEKVHEVKCWPQYFEHVFKGTKTFEVRVNDRNYWFGDILIQKEWDPERVETKGKDGMPRFGDPKGYTGRETKHRIGYIYPTGQLEKGREVVVLSLLEV